MSHPSEDQIAQARALEEVAADTRERLAADPAYHAWVDQVVAAMTQDLAMLGVKPSGEVARAFLMGSMAMLVALKSHTVGHERACFNEHVNCVWDRAVVMANNVGAPL